MGNSNRDIASVILISPVSSTAGDQTSRRIQNEGYVGGLFSVNVTVRGSTDAQGPVVTVQGLVPGTTNTWQNLLQSADLTSTSTAFTQILHVAPWVSTSANVRAAVALPRVFRVTSTFAGSSSVTYSVGVDLA